MRDLKRHVSVEYLRRRNPFSFQLCPHASASYTTTPVAQPSLRPSSSLATNPVREHQRPTLALPLPTLLRIPGAHYQSTWFSQINVSHFHSNDQLNLQSWCSSPTNPILTQQRHKLPPKPLTLFYDPGAHSLPTLLSHIYIPQYHHHRLSYFASSVHVPSQSGRHTTTSKTTTTTTSLFLRHRCPIASNSSLTHQRLTVSPTPLTLLSTSGTHYLLSRSSRINDPHYDPHCKPCFASIVFITQQPDPHRAASHITTPTANPASSPRCSLPTNSIFAGQRHKRQHSPLTLLSISSAHYLPTRFSNINVANYDLTANSASYLQCSLPTSPFYTKQCHKPRSSLVALLIHTGARFVRAWFSRNSVTKSNCVALTSPHRTGSQS